MSIMFANRSQQPTGAGYLLEFKAGRTLIEPGSSPEKRKAVAMPDQGLVYVKHSQDDQLLHFCWKNRKNNSIELDLIIFPGETEFLKINECKDGRVFMLKFKNSQERHLFWMQEAGAEKEDEEIKKKMNELLSNPPPPRTPATGQQSRQPIQLNQNQLTALGGDMESLGALQNMDQAQLMRLFAMVNGQAGGQLPADLLPGLVAGRPDGTGQGLPPGFLAGLNRRPQSQQGTGGSKEGTPSRETGTGGINAQMLSQIINALPGAGTSAGGEQQRVGVELSSVLTRNNTQEVVNKYKDQLASHLPNQGALQDPNTELNQTVGNPQFRQAADFLGQALQTGQMGSALEQFQLDKNAVEAAKKGDLVEFAEKLTAQENPKSSESDKQIAEEADSGETIDSELKKREAEAKKRKEAEEKAIKKKQQPKKRDDDDKMDLD